MSFGIDIKVDAPGALPTIAGVEAALAKVEAKGPAVGDAISKGLGAGAPAADKTTQSTEGLTEKLAALSNLGKNFGGALADQFKREGDMLEKIHGPAKQYADDLQALDGLMMRGAISTEEYAAQVTKMNQAIDGTKKSAEEAGDPAEKLGGIFEAMALPAAGAGILELGHKIADVVEQMERMEDEFTNLENKVVRFVDASHTSNELLDEQREVAEKLHVPMSSLLDVYDRVRVATDGLRLSHEEQIRIEQTLGAAMIVSGKSIDEAGGFMNRFAYAMESGSLGGGEFKRMMKEVPELGRQFSATMNMSVDQIQHFIDEGKIGPRDLLNSMKNNFGLIDADMAKRRVTNAQEIEAYTQHIKLLVGAGQGGTNAVAGAGLDQKSFQAQFLKNGFGASDAMDQQRAKDAIADIVKQGDAAVHLTDQFAKLGEARDKSMTAFMNAFANAPTLIDKVSASVGNLIIKLDDMGAHGADAWGKTDTAFGLGVKDSQDYAQKIGGARKQLEALRLEVAAHLLGADDARKKYEGLMTTLNDGRLPAAIKMYDAIHEPVRTFTEDVAALNGMLKEGTITWDEYDQQMQKVRASSVDPMVQLLNKFDAPLEQQTRGLELVIQAWELGTISLEHYNEEYARLIALTGETQANSVTGGAHDPTQGLSLPKIGGGDYQMPKADFSSVPAPQSYAHGLGTKAYEANQNYSSKAEKEQYDQFEKGATDAISGVDKGLKQLRDNTLDIGKTMTESITGAFNKMNESIVSMVTTGKADFGQLASFVEQALAKIALQEIEIGIISAFTGGAGGAVAKVAGSWSGSDTTIPHAANGYAGKVGGVGGTDTRLFAAMVTPGETVQIRTPEQMAAQGQGGGRQNVTIVNKHDTRGELAQGLANGDHDTAIVNVLKRNAGAVQALLRK